MNSNTLTRPSLPQSCSHHPLSQSLFTNLYPLLLAKIGPNPWYLLSITLKTFSLNSFSKERFPPRLWAFIPIAPSNDVSVEPLSQAVSLLLSGSASSPQLFYYHNLSISVSFKLISFILSIFLYL